MSIKSNARSFLIKGFIAGSVLFLVFVASPWFNVIYAGSGCVAGGSGCTG